MVFFYADIFLLLFNENVMKLVKWFNARPDSQMLNVWHFDTEAYLILQSWVFLSRILKTKLFMILHYRSRCLFMWMLMAGFFGGGVCDPIDLRRWIFLLLPLLHTFCIAMVLPFWDSYLFWLWIQERKMYIGVYIMLQLQDFVSLKDCLRVSFALRRNWVPCLVDWERAEWNSFLLVWMWTEILWRKTISHSLR